MIFKEFPLQKCNELCDIMWISFEDFFSALYIHYASSVGGKSEAGKRSLPDAANHSFSHVDSYNGAHLL